MNWLNNIKISRKLIAGFLLVALIACAIGLVGYTGMKSIQQSMMQVGKVYLPGIESLTSLKRSLEAILVGERGLLIEGLKDDKRQAQYDYINDAFATAIRIGPFMTRFPRPMN